MVEFSFAKVLGEPGLRGWSKGSDLQGKQARPVILPMASHQPVLFSLPMSHLEAQTPG